LEENTTPPLLFNETVSHGNDCSEAISPTPHKGRKTSGTSAATCRNVRHVPTRRAKAHPSSRLAIALTVTLSAPTDTWVRVGISKPDNVKISAYVPNGRFVRRNAPRSSVTACERC